jgi:hypothetical protein
VSPKTKEILLRQLVEQSGASDANTMQMNARTDERSAAQPRREQQRTGGTVGNPEVARIAALVLGTPEFQRQ